MADTTFVDFSAPPINAAWLNDVNTAVYKVSGLLKGNGTIVSAAVAGTDYAPATSGSSILYGNGSGGFNSMIVGSGLTFTGGTLAATGGAGTVTTVSIVSANGFAGTVATATSTPAITLTTSLAGLLKGNGTAMSAAIAGTDYVAPKYYNSNTTNALNYTNGINQRWAPATGAQTLSITNWPAAGNLAVLLIEGVNLGASTITWPTINWIQPSGVMTTTFSTYLASLSRTLQTSGIDFVTIWTRDAGTTLYGKLV